MLVSGGVEVIENDLIKLFLDLFGFSQNDIALTFDGGGFQLRILKNIG